VVKGPVYLTTPPCPLTREPDIGLAAEVVGADVVARYHRLCGHDVRLVAATVEHGRGVERIAYERGGTPQDYADQCAERWRAALDALDVICDDLLRTTEPRHQRVAKALFLKLFDQGDVYKGTRQGPYCPRCDEYVDDADTAGRCTACQEPLTEATEEAYFLRAAKYQKVVAEQLQNNGHLIQPAEHHEAVLREVLDEGIPDVCISRPRHDWAIPVPFDPDHAIDAWFDTLVSYLTSSGYLADPQLFERYWPPYIQIVSSDALGVHAMAWLVILAGLGLRLPQRLAVRGEFSFVPASSAARTRGAADPASLSARFGADAVRHAILRSAPYTASCKLSAASLGELWNQRVHGELCGFIEALLDAIERRCGGTIPQPGPLGSAEDELAESCTALFGETGEHIDALNFGAALDRIWDVLALARSYAVQTAALEPEAEPPSRQRADTALYVLAEAARLIALSTGPFLPGLAATIRTRLGIQVKGRQPPAPSQWGVTQPQTRICAGEPIVAPLLVAQD